jgi:hypothetical protein
VLSLLLDEHIRPGVAEQIVAKDPAARVLSIHHWHDGEFLSTDDEIILEAAYRESLTLVTFDQSTIRPVLKVWGEQGQTHGGIIFIDDKSIAQNDFGGLVKAIRRMWTSPTALCSSSPCDARGSRKLLTTMSIELSGSEKEKWL